MEKCPTTAYGFYFALICLNTHTFLNDIKEIISNVDFSVSFTTLSRIAYDEISWNKFVNTIILESPQSSEKWDGSGGPSPNRKYPPPVISSPTYSPPSPPSPKDFRENNDLYVILGLDFTTNLKEVKTNLWY